MLGITGRKDTSARLVHAPMHALGETYTRALHRVGGTPVILPPLLAEEDYGVLLQRLDGLLLSGGEDISPRHYHEVEEAGLGRVDTERDQAELGLVRRWIATGKPLLAICRGHQVLNVALGGSLYQDIATSFPEAIDHAYVPARPMENVVHSVTLTPESRLAHILGGTTWDVNSAHHQAIKRAGEGLEIVGYAPDGVVEAVERREHPFCLGVQWHPEAMVKLSETMWPLFAAFVKAAADGKQ